MVYITKRGVALGRDGVTAVTANAIEAVTAKGLAATITKATEAVILKGVATAKGTASGHCVRALRQGTASRDIV